VEKAAIPATSDCDDLQRLADDHLVTAGDDALFVFLRVHHCICVSVQRTYESAALRRANGFFVKRCAEIYRNFHSGRCAPHDLSDRWVTALEAYSENKHSYLVLVKMAKAHILDDLPECLYGVSITKQEYDDVFLIIVSCLRQVLRKAAGNVAANKIKALLLDNAVGHVRLRLLRERAWKKVERRRELARKAVTEEI